MKRIFNFFASIVAILTLSQFVAQAQVTGKIFRDFDADAVQNSQTTEPGVKDVTVTAYLDNGSSVIATTDSLGLYSFSAAQLPPGTKIRIEFTNLPTSYQDGFVGSNTNTTVQFVTAGAGVTANLILILPSHFTTTKNPYFSVVNYARNNDGGTVPTVQMMDTNSRRAFVAKSATDASNDWSVAAGMGDLLSSVGGNYIFSNVSLYPIPTKYEVANKGEVNSVYGLAFNKKTKELLSGAYMKAFASMGTNSSANGYGEAIIYKTPINGNTVSTPSVWLDLETLLGDNVAGSYLPDPNHPGTNVYGTVGSNPNKIGYVGLGHIKFNANFTELYVVNLNQLEVLVIPIDANGNPPTSPSSIKRFPLPTTEAPGNWPNGNPYRAVLGLGVHPTNGKVYATLTCTGPAVTNLKGVVYSFDPADVTPSASDFVKEFEIPLNIKRPVTTASSTNYFDNLNHPWENHTPGSKPYTNGLTGTQPLNSQHNQPWLGEIIFDILPNGAVGMSIGERNRYFDLIGSSAFVSCGAVFRAVQVGGAWVLENNKVAGPITSTVNFTFSPATTAGANTDVKNRFYQYLGCEGATSQGTLEHIPGSEDVFMPAMDNVMYVGTSGIMWMNKTSGKKSYDARLIGNCTNSGFAAVSFGKANNFGDIEMMGECPPIEIGNRVWLDTDKDGVQDPSENGIEGVLLELVDAAGNPVDSDPNTVGIQPATVSTDVNGTWIFSSAAGIDATGKNFGVDLKPNIAYKVRLATSGPGNDWDPSENNGAGGPRFGGALEKLQITLANVTGGAASDLNDNDASLVNSVPEISFTLGGIGNNNHTYDFGFFKPIGSLGNYVWYDMNGDGIQNEPDSSGINGQKVYLFNAITNVRIDSTITANDGSGKPGYYLFDSLESGVYHVDFPITIGVNKLTTQTAAAGVDSNSDANLLTGESPDVVINVYGTGVSKDNMTIDAGYWPIGSLGNYVWYDDDGNGLQNEVVGNGINGQKVYLLNGTTNAIIDSTLTANNPLNNNPGFYLFDSLSTGNYKVQFPMNVDGNLLTSQTITPATDNNSDANTSNGRSPDVFINALSTGVAKDNMTIDAGYLPLGTLGNYIWLDSNKNGVNTEVPAAGINGVTVYLKNNATNAIIDSTATANNGGNPGFYLFDSLKKGDYVVVFPTNIGTNLLTSQTSTTALDNVSDPDVVTGNSPVVSLDPKLGGINQHNLTIDAGYIIPTPATFGSLGNYVWYDDDGNGIQNEPTANGINGQTVYLQKETAPGSNIYTNVDTTNTANNPTTSAPGFYLFDSLTSGNYRVQFPAIVNTFSLTPIVNQAPTTDNNNDANILGLSGVVNINTAGVGIQVNNMTIDAGYLPVGTIGNRLWRDDNGNSQDDEPFSNGINGLKVYLQDNATGAIIDSQTTATNLGIPGHYLFTNVKKGDYSVAFPLVSSTDKLSQQSLSTADGTSKPNNATGVSNVIVMDPKLGGLSKDNPTIDAGYAPLGSLGNYVWLDANRNGIKDELATAGINGVTVYLMDALTNDTLHTMVTADSAGNPAKPGYYNFPDLNSGTYRVQFPKTLSNGSVLTPVVFASTSADNNNDADNTTGLSAIVTINAAGAGVAKDNPTIDAGYWQPASIGNRVWLDDNKDGLQTPGELGVANITITLYDNNFKVVGSSITDAYGYYKFAGLVPGDYSVVFTPPANYHLTQFDPAGDNGNDNNSDADTSYGFYYATTPFFNLIAGEYDSTVDCGIYLPKPITATVGDRVWQDANKNGLQDPGEPGISDITVTIYDSNNKPIASTITDFAGHYLFSAVPPGNNYFIQFGEPVGYITTTKTGSVLTSSNSDANLNLKTDLFNVTPGDSIMTIDAGFYPADSQKCALGNRVWYDNNNNGIQDKGETGVENVMVYLKNAANIIIDSLTTDVLGEYHFNNLDAGTYSVLFAPSTLPSGFVFTSQNQGTDDEKDGDENNLGQTGIYTLKPGDRNLSIDAGVIHPTNNNSIGDKVWLDANKNGVQETNEPITSGITVTLFDTIGNVLNVTTTDLDGAYRFNGLPDGTYRVGFSNLPYGFGLTSQNVGTNDSLDSDAQPSSGKTQSVSVSGGMHNPTLDAGIFPQSTPSSTASLGDRVWFDDNNNGKQNRGEVGVQDVVAILFDLGPDELRGTADDGITKYMYTDVEGIYAFNGLPAGNYMVGFTELPVGYSTSPALVPADPIDDSNIPVGVAITSLTDTLYTSVVHLALGEENLTIDAGIHKADVNRLGNFVWYDTDKDGIQDATEIGVKGVEAILLNPDGSFFDRDTAAGLQRYVTITDERGYYQFIDIPDGSYKVVFGNIPAGYKLSTPDLGGDDNLDSDPNAITFTTPVVMVGVANRSNQTLDVGIFSDTKAGLGNYVWLDADRDGIQDANESPLPGILVTLFDGNNTPISATVTDPYGRYIFNNLDAGAYQVGFTNNPVGSLPTTPDINAVLGSDLNPNTGRSSFVLLPPDSINLHVDGGFSPVHEGALGDYVWYDDNQNGIQDLGEKPVPGVTALLTEAASGQVIGTSVTDANGFYLFHYLDADLQYIVTFNTLPLHYTFTKQSGLVANATNSDADELSGKTSPATVPENGINPNVDAGIYRPLGSIGNYVWLDNNGNGAQDEAASEGINGVKVYLLNGVTNAIIDSTITMNDTLNNPGYYLFDSLLTDQYIVQFPTTTSGVQLTKVTEQSPTTDLNSDAAITTGQSGIVTINTRMTGVNKDNMTIDAGYTPVGSIGNYVWYDKNRNGIQDSIKSPWTGAILGPELPVPGVAVELYNNNNVLLLVDTTDATGHYAFDSIPLGNYFVKFVDSTLPLKYQVTIKNAGVNDSLDSDVDAITFQTDTTNITANEVDYRWDLGIYKKDTLVIKDPCTCFNIEYKAGETKQAYEVVELMAEPNDTWIIVSQSGMQKIDSLAGPNVQIPIGDTIKETGPGTGIYDLPFLFPIGGSYSITVTNGYDTLSHTNVCYGTNAANLNIDDTLICNTPTVTTLIGGATRIDASGTHPAVGTFVYYYIGAANDTNYITQFNKANFGFDTTITLHAEFTPTDAQYCPLAFRKDILIEACYGSIGNYVWYDKNRNGIQDSIKSPWTGAILGPELPVPGVAVELYNNSNVLLLVDTTDAMGHYSFDSIPLGNYYVKFVDSTLPAKYQVTVKNAGVNDSLDSDVDAITFQTDTTNITANEVDYRWDLGIYKKDTLVIKDPCTCFNIEYKAGETKQAYEVVELMAEPNDTWIIVSQSGMQKIDSLAGPNVQIPIGDTIKETGPGTGIYDLPFLFPIGGSYSITVTNGYDTLSHTNVCYGTNAANLNIDDTLICNTPTVTTLIGSATRIDASGTHPAVGTFVYYYIGAANDTNYITQFNKANFGFDTTITLHAEFTPTDAQYCPLAFRKDILIEACYGSIGNYVWKDANADGLQNESGMPGINGVIIYLLDASNVIIDSVITANDGASNPGYYLFDRLSSGTYYVQFPTTANGGVLSNPTFTAQTDGNSDANIGTGISPAVVINAAGSGQDKDNTTIDAGYFAFGSIGNYVWYGINANGLQDEPASSGINNQMIYLYQFTDTGYVVRDSMLTVNDGSGNPGYYIFDSLPSNDYYVQFPVNVLGAPLTVVNPSSTTDGNSDADPLDAGVTLTLTIDAYGTGLDKNNPTIDAGYTPLGSLGNRVWIDTNQNGLYDDGPASGINGVNVYLYLVDGATLVLIDSMVTMNDSVGNPGYYLFDRLPSGDYVLQFPVVAAGGGLTDPTMGTGMDDNSNADTLSGYTEIITIINSGGGLNQNNPTIDAGYKPAGPLTVDGIEITATKAANSNFVTWKGINPINVVSYKLYAGTTIGGLSVINEQAANATNTYTFVDRNIVNGTIYYMAQAIDINGKVQNSKIASLTRSETLQISAYPNPTVDMLQVSIDYATSNRKATILLRDNTGKLVRQIETEVQANIENVISVDMSSLASGQYNVEVIMGAVKKVIAVQKI